MICLFFRVRNENGPNTWKPLSQMTFRNIESVLCGHPAVRVSQQGHCCLSSIKTRSDTDRRSYLCASCLCGWQKPVYTYINIYMYIEKTPKIAVHFDWGPLLIKIQTFTIVCRHSVYNSSVSSTTQKWLWYFSLTTEKNYNCETQCERIPLHTSYNRYAFYN